MMLFIATAALLISQVTGNGLANPKEPTFEELKTLKVVKSQSTAAPTEYLVTSLYADQYSCTGTSYSSTGIGFGTCMGGGSFSVKYTNPSQNSTHISYTYNYYYSSDCSGTASIYSVLTFTTGCYINTGYGLKNSVVSATSSSAPWANLGNGIVTETYAEENSCSSGANSDLFSFSALNECIPVASADYKSQSEMFTGCGSTIDYVLYADTECRQKLSTGSGPLGKCYLEFYEYKTNSCATK